MISNHLLLLALNILALSISLSNCKASNGHRQKRLFSLFNIVQFNNDPCITQTSSATRGTCLSASDCSREGGIPDGNCASGFGVCCLFALSGCGGAVSKNCTYIRNRNFPSGDPQTGETCQYTFNRICDGICQIRLDFDTTVLPLSNGLAGICGGTGDELNVGSPFSTNQAAFPPTLCGTLTGQHMYFETTDSGPAGTLTIDKGTGVGDRTYNIKVSYIGCCTKYKAPQGCTQYFTGTSGTIKSYNFDGGQLLQSMQYGNCVRQEQGYCQVTYKESQVTTPDPFALTGIPATKSACINTNYVTIPSLTRLIVDQPTINTNAESLEDFIFGTRCGGVFGARTQGTTFTMPTSLTSSRNIPFVLRLFTVPSTPTGVSFNQLTGFSLDYSQVPC